jgi:hypothetical protein
VIGQQAEFRSTAARTSSSIAQGRVRHGGRWPVAKHSIRRRQRMSPTVVRPLFVVAGLYDLVIGLTFLFFGPRLFETTGVPQPNHWAYIQFGSLLLMIFGAMFFAVAYDPAANRNLIPFGMLLKLSYTGLVAYYWATTDCPTLFKPFAVIDAVMLVLFYLAYARRPAMA